MRRAGVAVGVIVCAARGVRAQTAPPPVEPEYPIELTDRPLLLLGGMTSVDMSFDLPSYFYQTTDAMGRSTTARTPLGRFVDPQVDVHHGLGTMEVFGAAEFAANFVAAEAGGSLRLGSLPAIATVSVTYSRNQVVPYYLTESASCTYKALLVPKRFAVQINAGGEVSEGALHDTTGTTTTNHFAEGFANVDAVIQLMPTLAVEEQPSFYLPLFSKPGPVPGPGLGESTQVTVTTTAWDYYVALVVGGLTDRPIPEVFVGAVWRPRWHENSPGGIR